MAKVAFIGLGVMGFPMAGHLAAKGHEVTVYNRSPGPRERLARQGAQCFDRPALLFAACDGIVVMLAFGLGTVPLLWLAQSQFQLLRRKLTPLWLGRLRITLALATAAVISWRLRATLGFPGPDPTNFVCF